MLMLGLGPIWLRPSPAHTPLSTSARASDCCCRPRIDRLLYLVAVPGSFRRPLKDDDDDSLKDNREPISIIHDSLGTIQYLFGGSVYANKKIGVIFRKQPLRPPKLNSQFIVSNFYKKHAGGRSFFIIHCRFCPSSQCKIWPRPLTLSRAHKPVRQCKLNFALVSMINNE